MSEKRKDNKGRLLKTGESQRQDFTYMYRYKDNDGVRRCVYAPTLTELREKEDEIEDKLRDGVIAGSRLTVGELVKQYIDLKHNLKHTTATNYDVSYRHILASSFSHLQVQEVTKSAVKQFYIELSDGGLGFSSIETLAKVLKPAFNQAVEDEIITKNPAKFPLTDVMPKARKHRNAVSQEDLDRFLEFVQSVPKYAKYYNQIMILAYTGVRVSELCALTVRDIDFAKKRIAVTKQTSYCPNYGRYIETTKTEAGERFIAIDPILLPCLQDVVRTAKERKQQPIVNGYGGFLFVTKHGEMCIGSDVGQKFRTIMSKYNELHADDMLPKITPHVLRHTFCTRCISEYGMDVKSVQYFMGHASASVTMDIYSHTSYESAERALLKACAH